MNDNQTAVYTSYLGWKVFVRICEIMKRIVKFFWCLTRHAFHLILSWPARTRLGADTT